MFVASCWIVYPLRTYLAVLEIERIGYEKSIRFSSHNLSYVDEFISNVQFLRNYQCALMRDAVKQTERRRCHIHLSIAYHNVAIASKAFEAPVSMNILVICIQEISVANHKIEYGIPIAIRLGRIPAEHIIYRATIMITGGHLAVAVVCDFTPGVS